MLSKCIRGLRHFPVKVDAAAQEIFEICKKEVGIMSTTKDDIKGLLDKLPNDCSVEDVQYHLYVVSKIQRGLQRAEAGEVCTQGEVERKFAG